MKFHFTWTMSANEKMEKLSRIAIASIKKLGVPAHCTITVLEQDYDHISNAIKKNAEVKIYRPHCDTKDPWRSTPKWEIEPQGDIVVGIDADVMVWRPDLVLQAAEECLTDNVLCGTIAYDPPFSQEEWLRAFEIFELSPEFNYQYTAEQTPSPFYINNGVMMIPASMLHLYKDNIYKWLQEVNKIYGNSYFMSQIATTIAIRKANLPVRAMPDTFNYLEYRNIDLDKLENVAFLHYNVTREQITNKVENPILEEAFKQLLEEKKKIYL